MFRHVVSEWAEKEFKKLEAEEQVLENKVSRQAFLSGFHAKNSPVKQFYDNGGQAAEKLTEKIMRYAGF